MPVTGLVYRYMLLFTLSLCLFLCRQRAQAADAANGLEDGDFPANTSNSLEACLARQPQAGHTAWQDDIVGSSISVEWTYGNVSTPLFLPSLFPFII